MRLALLASVVFISMLAFSVRHHWAPKPSRDARASAQPLASQHSNPSELAWYERIDAYGENVKAAEQDGLSKAMLKLMQYLRDQRPPILWQPSPEYVREHLLHQAGEAMHKSNRGVHFVELPYRVEVTAKHLAEMQEFDRKLRSLERMGWLAKLLGGTLAIQLGLAAYVYLDERTKGYYNGWLRLGFGGLVAVVGTSVFWLV